MDGTDNMIALNTCILLFGILGLFRLMACRWMAWKTGQNGAAAENG
jgi:hypothetical protein